MARCGCSSGCACLIHVQDTSCINMDITGSGSSIDAYIISAAPVISPDAGNQIVCNGNGLFVSSGGGARLPFYVVADDGTGDFTSIKTAIETATAINNANEVVIYVKGPTLSDRYSDVGAGQVDLNLQNAIFCFLVSRLGSQQYSQFEFGNNLDFVRWDFDGFTGSMHGISMTGFYLNVETGAWIDPSANIGQLDIIECQIGGGSSSYISADKPKFSIFTRCQFDAGATLLSSTPGNINSLTVNDCGSVPVAPPGTTSNNVVSFYSENCDSLDDFPAFTNSSVIDIRNCAEVQFNFSGAWFVRLWDTVGADWVFDVTGNSVLKRQSLFINNCDMNSLTIQGTQTHAGGPGDSSFVGSVSGQLRSGTFSASSSVPTAGNNFGCEMNFAYTGTALDMSGSFFNAKVQFVDIDPVTVTMSGNNNLLIYNGRGTVTVNNTGINNKVF